MLKNKKNDSLIYRTSRPGQTLEDFKREMEETYGSELNMTDRVIEDPEEIKEMMASMGLTNDEQKNKIGFFKKIENAILG